MKQRKSFLKRNRWLFLFMFAFSLYFAYNMYTTDIKLKEYEAIQTNLTGEINRLEKDVDQLSVELEYSKTPEAIEKIAREKLKMVKANEIIYIIESEEGSKK